MGGMKWAFPAWTGASLLLMAIGAMGPWATVLALMIHGTDGSRDGWVVIGAAVVAILTLLLFARFRRKWLLVFPLLAGAAGAATAGYDISDIKSLASGETALGSDLVHVDWGVYVALVGSISLAVASLALFFVPGRAAAPEPAAVDLPPEQPAVPST